MSIQDHDEPNVDLTSTGTVAKFEPSGKAAITTVFENAGGSVTVELQVRERGGTWRTYHDYGSVSAITDTKTVSASEARIQITATTLSAGETGDFYVGTGD